MSIYVIANRKGGVGKTNTAINLAVYLGSKGSVLLVDADDQRTASKWHTRRNRDDIALIYLQGAIDTQIQSYLNDYDNIVIDVAGRESIEFKSSLFIADKLFIPTQASQFDLDVLPEVTKFVDQIQEVANPELKKYFFISRASTNAKSKDADVVSDFLRAQYPSYITMKSRLHERVQFKEASGDGKSVLDLPKSNKAKEDFYNFLLEAL